MGPSLLKSLGVAISKGQIEPLEPGSILLARFESRIIFIRALEMWFEGSSVSIMGAELEPTSCHALEGTEVDAVLDAALQPTQPATFTNPHLLHSLKVA